jgi:hypothetical protein
MHDLARVLGVRELKDYNRNRTSFEDLKRRGGINTDESPRIEIALRIIQDNNQGGAARQNYSCFPDSPTSIASIRLN